MANVVSRGFWKKFLKQKMNKKIKNGDNKGLTYCVQ